MKRFISNSVAFIIILSILFHIKPIYLLINEKYKNTVAGAEIYHSIFKSKQRKKAKKLLLGDSVGRQLFPETSYNDTVNSLACNQAIELVGQYILLNNYINSGNIIDTVYLLCTPFSFKSNINNKYTFHYFLKPFYIDEYKPLFTKTVNEQIDKIPYANFCRLPYILTSNWAPNLTKNVENSNKFLSPVSIEYLIKIKELSIKHNFKFIIVPTPTSINKKQFVNKMDKIEIHKYKLDKEFENYFENIIYLNDNTFVDGTHFKTPSKYTEIYRKIFIK